MSSKNISSLFGGIKDQPVAAKVTEMLTYVINEFDSHIADVENKFKDPFSSRERVISEVIDEFGSLISLT